MNMDYIRNPGILYADLKCPEIAENVAPGAFASEVEDASRSHFTSLHRRIVGHALDANELPYYDSDYQLSDACVRGSLQGGRCVKVSANLD